MGRWIALFATVAAVVGASGQEKKANPPTRYDVAGDAENYPQGSPRETLTSVAKAIDRERFDYLLAHLTDSKYVDEKVKQLGNFREFVAAVRAHLSDDPKRHREFMRFLKEGTIEASGSEAKVSLKDVPTRQLKLRQDGKRWFLQNEDTPNSK